MGGAGGAVARAALSQGRTGGTGPHSCLGPYINSCVARAGAEQGAHVQRVRSGEGGERGGRAREAARVGWRRRGEWGLGRGGGLDGGSRPLSESPTR